MAKPLIPAERIYDAALALLDESGVPGLNAKNLSERLRCSTQTLYQVVGNREQMIRGVVRHAFAQMELDFRPTDDLRTTVYSWSMTLRTAMLAQPTLASLMAVEDREVVTTYGEPLVHAFLAHGFTPATAVRAAGIISHITVSMTVGDIRAPGVMDDPEIFETALVSLTDGLIRLEDAAQLS